MTEAVQRDDSRAADSNLWFFKKTTLEELLRGVQPLASIDDLALDDLTPEEAQSFLRSISE